MGSWRKHPESKNNPFGTLYPAAYAPGAGDTPSPRYGPFCGFWAILAHFDLAVFGHMGVQKSKNPKYLENGGELEKTSGDLK